VLFLDKMAYKNPIIRKYKVPGIEKTLKIFCDKEKGELYTGFMFKVRSYDKKEREWNLIDIYLGQSAKTLPLILNGIRKELSKKKNNVYRNNILWEILVYLKQKINIEKKNEENYYQKLNNPQLNYEELKK